MSLNGNATDFFPNKVELVAEGQRQFQVLIEQNEQNRRDGCPEDNIYVFSFLSTDNWYRYIKDTVDAPEFANSYIVELNNRLKSFNENTDFADFAMYVCLVSELEVEIAFDYTAFNTTTIPEIIDQYKKFEEVIGDESAGNSAISVEALQTQYQALIDDIYNGVDVNLITTNQNYQTYKTKQNRTLLTNTAVKVVISDPIFGEKVKKQRRIYGGTVNGYFKDHLDDILAYEKSRFPDRGDIVFRNRVLSFLEFAEGYMHDPAKKQMSSWYTGQTDLGNSVQGAQSNVDYTNAEMILPQIYLFDYTGVFGTKAQAANDQINQLLSGTQLQTDTKIRTFVTDDQVAQTRIDAIKNLDLTNSYFDNTLVLWIHIKDNGDIKSTIRLSDDLDALLQNAISTDRFDNWIEIGLREANSNAGKEILTFLIEIVYVSSNFLVEVIETAEIPEKYYRCDLATYDPILKNVFSFVNPTMLLSDFVMDPLYDAYPVLNGQGSPSEIQFALFCGVWNGLLEELKGAFELISMVGYWVDDSKKQEVDGMINVFKEGKLLESVKNGLVQAHTGPACHIAHTIGKDIVAVVTLVVPFTKASSLSKVRKVINVLDALNPITHAFNAAGFVLRKTAGQVIEVVIDANNIKVAILEEDWLIAVEDELYGGAIPFVGQVEDIPYENLAVGVMNQGQQTVVPTALAIFIDNFGTRKLGRIADAANTYVNDIRNLFHLDELFEDAAKAEMIAGKVALLDNADQLMLNANLLTKISGLPKDFKKRFFSDLADSPQKSDPDFFGNHIDVISEDFIDAWQSVMVFGSSASEGIRTSFTRLEEIVTQINIQPAKLLDFKAKFASVAEDAKIKLLDDLEWFFGFKPSYFKEDIMAISNGSRPSPSNYLTPNYISQHLAKFTSEGGAFLVVKSWIETGSYNSFPPKKFAMLKSDMQKIIDEYNTSGDLAVIEKGLGYNQGDLSGLAGELYVFYPNASQYSFNMPSGNEIGANNLWEAGGFTSGGKREAILEGLTNPNEVIVHDKDINNLINQFDYEKL